MPIQPANPLTVSNGDSDKSAVAAGQNEDVNNNGLPRVQGPKSLKNISGKKRTRGGDGVEPHLQKKGMYATIHDRSAVADTS